MIHAPTMDYLPSRYHHSPTVTPKLLTGVVDPILDEAKIYASEYGAQRVVGTATWGLTTWEEELDLPVPSADDIHMRRAIILARLRGAGTTTKAKLEHLGAEFSGGTVEVEEHFEDFHTRIKFVGTRGVPANLHIFISTVEELLPAHLTYEFVYSYLDWLEFDAYDYTWSTWDQKDLTWVQFEEYNGI